MTMNSDEARRTIESLNAVGSPVERRVRRAAPTRADSAELLMQLVTDTPRCMALLEALDKAAKEQNGYEYGLPLWDEPQAARLREVLYKWACGTL